MMGQQPEQYGERPGSRQDPPGIKFFVDMSNSVLIFFRKDVGYRLIDQMAVARHSLLLIGLGAVATQWPKMYENAPYGGYALIFFGLMILVRSSQIRKQSLAANLAAHNPLHSMSRGRSKSAHRFARIRINELTVQRSIEPFYSVLIGACFFVLNFVILGLWLIVAGICLAIVERHVDIVERDEISDAQDANAKAKWLTHSVPTLKSEQTSTSQPTAKKASAPASTSPELNQLRQGNSRQKK